MKKLKLSDDFVWTCMMLLFVSAAIVAFVFGKFLEASVISMVASILGAFWFKPSQNIGKFSKFKVDKNLSYNENVQKLFSLRYMFIWKKKQNKKIRTGGFAVPFLPFFIMLSKQEGIDPREIAMHEMAHSMFFIYAMQVTWFYIALYIMTWVSILLGVIVIISLMLFQEYLAFTATREMGERFFGLKFRKWNWQVFTKYIVYYSGWMASLTAIMLLAILTAKIWLMAIIIPWIFIYGRLMKYFIDWINKRWPSSLD